MNYYDQHAYIVIALAKSVIALSLAVNICAIPLTLYFFGKFPLISLIYNLIIPFLVSLVMFFFIVGIFIPWIHPLNHALTQFTVDCVHHLPAPLHLHIRFPLDLSILICWMTLIAVVGIFGWAKTRNRLEFTY
jgi:competence protein ComEC